MIVLMFTRYMSGSAVTHAYQQKNIYDALEPTATTIYVFSGVTYNTPSQEKMFPEIVCFFQVGDQTVDDSEIPNNHLGYIKHYKTR